MLAACGPATGSYGGECNFSGSILHPSYHCDEGLVCNTARDPKICERPNENGLGAACGSDVNCLESLYCPVSQICTARIKEGDPCPSGIGCEAGLECKKDESGITCQQP